MKYYPRAGDRHDVNGIEITGYQLAFAMMMHGYQRRYWVSEYNDTLFTYESRSKDLRLVQALANKGLIEVRTERYQRHPGDPSRNVRPSEADRTVYTLMPGLSEFIETRQAEERAREIAGNRAMHERHAREQAERDAYRREQQARAMAVEALIKNHPIAFEDQLEAAYRLLDAKSIQEA